MRGVRLNWWEPTRLEWCQRLVVDVRVAGVGAAVAFVVVACGSAGPLTATSSASPNEVPTTVAPAVTTMPASPSTTDASATTISESGTTVTPDTGQPVDFIVDGSLPVDARYLVYGPDGIIALVQTGELVRISSDPTAIAIGIGDDLIVSQGGVDFGDVRLHRQGPIIVHDPGGAHSLPLSPDEQLRLYDAGMVDGRPVAIATTLIGTGWETDERLLLIDLATGERADLGTVGYYEATVEEAKLAGEMIIVKPFGQGHLIEARGLDGETVWSVDGPDGFEKPGHVVVTGDAVLVINPGFEGDDFSPVVEIARYNVTSGDQVSFEVVPLDAEFGGGFCLIPDWDGAQLVCEESYGGPFTVDIEAGSVTRLTSLESGIASTVRGWTP